MTKKVRLNLYCIMFILISLFYNQAVCAINEVPAIVAGTAKITGKITVAAQKNPESIYVNLYVPHPISGEHVSYSTLIDQSGKFSIDIEVETSVSLIAMSTSLNTSKYFLIKLTNTGLSNIEMAYNSALDIENIQTTPAMNSYELNQAFTVRDKMIRYKPNRLPQPMYNKSTEYYLEFAKMALAERLEIVNKDTSISKELKEILSKDYRLILYKTHVFDYHETMLINYNNTNNDEDKKPEFNKIDRFYYGFLKDFKLNDMQYLQTFEFLEFQKKILQNEVLALPEIGDSTIPSWLKKVKAIIADLVGFDKGPYYDILAANAYGKQLNESIRPLSNKQKENIVNYWKNGEIAKILFRKNLEVLQFNKEKTPAVVHDIASVADDKVIERILTKYKNKVVLIDLWATWCVPCIRAMERFKSSKAAYKDKDVVFVYLTNASSPHKLWQEKIEGIGDEHYYLTDSQWNYIMEYFDFEAIPSYLLYNKEGILKHKFTAFPENNKMIEMINEAL